jgi:hypothetical protein
MMTLGFNPSRKPTQKSEPGRLIDEVAALLALGVARLRTRSSSVGIGESLTGLCLEIERVSGSEGGQ